MDINLVRVAYGTDMGLFGPTALSLLSAIYSTPMLRHVDILSFNLTGTAIEILQDIAKEREVSIQFHHLKDEDFATAPSQVKHISKTTLARLMLPEIVKHRVVYIDGDTLVRRNLAELYKMDMEGKLIGGVRDFGCLEGSAKALEGKDWKYESEKSAIMWPLPPTDYINAGVLVMDCEAIREDQEVRNDINDFDVASKYRSLDQDHINKVFAGKIKYLNPAWNSSWGRAKQQREWTKKLGVRGSEVDTEKQGIYHFHGPIKPWHKVPVSKLRRNPYAVWSYKFEKMLFERKFPTAFDLGLSRKP